MGRIFARSPTQTRISMGFSETEVKALAVIPKTDPGSRSTGVTVITVEREPGSVFGMTANAFTSVSLNPMLILVCVGERAKILPMLHKKKRFVNRLLKHQ